MGWEETLIGAGLGLMTGGLTTRRQEESQKRMNAEGVNNSKEMTLFNRKQQMKLWEDTNYSAQREQMEKAGLNVGLMYEGGGGGGGTTGLQTASQSGGNARTNNDSNEGMAMQMQNSMLEAQKSLIQAQTEKTIAEKKKLEGVDTFESGARTTSLLQGVENAKAQKILTEAQTMLTNENYQGAISQVQMLRNDAQISENTITDKIRIIREEAIGKKLDNLLTTEKTKLTQEQTEEVKQKIKSMIAGVEQGWEKLSQSEKQLKINKFNAEINAQFQGSDKVLGGLINQAIMETDDMLNMKPIKQKVE